MFTGIVRAICPIAVIERRPGLMHFAIRLPKEQQNNLETGASIAVNGVCLTVVVIDGDNVWFDAIEETLQRTNLSSLEKGSLVNVERAARFGDEIGGHILSGHIIGMAEISSIQEKENNCALFLRCPMEQMKYLFSKGYIALNGVSLTLVDVQQENGVFSVHLIPETLQRTTFGTCKVGDRINMEIESTTQTIVDTVERLKLKCRQADDRDFV